MDQEQPLHNEEPLSQLTKKELVKIILAQQKIITELQTKIEKLILSRDLDSKNSSKPPSSDLLKKPEKKQEGKEKLNFSESSSFKAIADGKDFSDRTLSNRVTTYID